MKSWLQDSDIKMYSTHNEGASIAAETFIRTLKIKKYKYMTSVSGNVYIDKLDDIVNEYSKTYNSTNKKKPVDVKSRTYIDINKEIIKEYSKFEVGDHVKISHYKNIFLKVYTSNWYE